MKLSSVGRPGLSGTAAAIIGAALETFSARGYHGTSMRDIAGIVGIRPGAVYNHFASKQELLFYIVDTGIAALHNGLVDELAAVEDPEQQLARAIGHHVRFHGTNPAQTQVIDRELSALLPPNRRQIAAKRKAYEGIFVEIIRNGQRAGRYAEVDATIAAYALIGMGTEVATWFHPEGRLTLDQVEGIYRQLAVQALGVP